MTPTSSGSASASCIPGELSVAAQGPEFGKMLGPGNILYIKPGWGVDSDELQGDRKFTFEIGWRKFL